MVRTATTLSILLLASVAIAQTPEAPAEAAPKAKTAAPAPDAATPPAEASMKAFAYAPKDTDLVYGKADAPVTMVEYASLSCPHCAAFYKEVFPELKKRYIDTGKVKLVYRNYPLNQPALEAAQMVLCADKDAQPTYIKVLFTTQDKWAYDANFHESLAGIAVLGGMDRKKYDECMADKKKQSSILLTYQEARDNYKITSTPTIFIGSDLLKGSHNLESVSKMIEDALAAAPKK